MYNYLVLSALRVVAILSRQKYSPGFMCISKGEYQRFQALVFALFVFSDFFIFCGANAGK